MTIQFHSKISQRYDTVVLRGQRSRAAGNIGFAKIFKMPAGTGVQAVVHLLNLLRADADEQLTRHFKNFANP